MMSKTDKTLNESEDAPQHTQQILMMDMDALYQLRLNALEIFGQDQCKSIQYGCALILSKYICNQIYIKETRNDIRDFPIKTPKLINWNSLLDLAAVKDDEICACINILMTYINITNKGTKLYLPEDYTSIPNGIETIPAFINEFERVTGPVPCGTVELENIFDYLSEEFQIKTDTANINPRLDPAGFIHLMTLTRSMESMKKAIQRINQYMGTTE